MGVSVFIVNSAINTTHFIRQGNMRKKIRLAIVSLRKFI